MIFPISPICATITPVKRLCAIAVVVVMACTLGCQAVHHPNERQTSAALAAMQQYRTAYQSGDAKTVRSLLDDSTEARKELADAIAAGAEANARVLAVAAKTLDPSEFDQMKSQWHGFSAYRSAEMLAGEKMWIDGLDIAIGSNAKARLKLISHANAWCIRFEPADSESDLLKKAREEQWLADATVRLAEDSKSDPDQAFETFAEEVIRIRMMRQAQRAESQGTRSVDTPSSRP